jgi:hypothetical protein
MTNALEKRVGLNFRRLAVSERQEWLWYRKESRHQLCHVLYGTHSLVESCHSRATK